MLKRLFAPERDSWITSFALLVLRLWLGLTMLINHGLPKLTGFEKMKEQFPGILGLSPGAALSLAIFGEVFCSLLIISGLLTRFGALGLACTMFVAFGIAHKFVLTGPQSGEMAFIYLAGFIALLIAGPGRFSPDQRIFGAKQVTTTAA